MLLCRPSLNAVTHIHVSTIAIQGSHTSKHQKVKLLSQG